MSELKHRVTIEKVLASRTGKLCSFKDKWKLYADIFDTGAI